MKWASGLLALLLAQPVPQTTVSIPGRASTMVVNVQGNASGTAVPISGSVTVSSASVTQGTSPWVTQDNHTTAGGPLSCELSTGAAFYDARSIRALTSADVVSAAQSGSWTNACTQSGTWTVQQGTTQGTNAGAWWVEVGDTTNGPAAVKAPSTAAVAADKAIVVAVSPNNTIAATESGTWSTRAQDGAGNALTSNSTTVVGKFALDSNLLGTLGTAFSTAGKVDVKAADGDVFVRQASASNLNATVTQGTAAASSGGWPVKVTDGTTVAGVIAGTTALKSDLSSVAGTATGTVAAGVLKAGIVDSANVSITQVAKGTQAANFLGVQDAKDSGRVNISWTINGTAATQTGELLMTVTESRDGAAATTFTTKVVTSGKRLRLTHASGFVELTTGTGISRNRIRIRFNTAGAVTTASPLQVVIAPPSVATTTKTAASFFVDFPDGIEFLGDGTKQIGVTWESPEWVSATTVSTLYLTIFGYEY